MDNQEYQLVENFLDTRSEMTFRKLYRTYTPSLYALSLRFCAQDKSMAEELVQETWIRFRLHSIRVLRQAQREQRRRVDSVGKINGLYLRQRDFFLRKQAYSAVWYSREGDWIW